MYNTPSEVKLRNLFIILLINLPGINFIYVDTIYTSCTHGQTIVSIKRLSKLTKS